MKKKKLLILAYEYRPTENANTRILGNLCERLAESCELDIVTAAPPGTVPGEEATSGAGSGAEISPASDPGRNAPGSLRILRVPEYSFHREKCTGPLTPGILCRMVSAKITGRLTHDETVRMVSRLYEHGIRKAVRLLDYDAVLSFSGPFLAHECASRIVRGKKIPWIPVYFDPFFSNRIFDPGRTEARKKREERLMEPAAKVLLMYPTDLDYLRAGVSFREKITGFEVPGVTLQAETVTESGPASADMAPESGPASADTAPGPGTALTDAVPESGPEPESKGADAAFPVRCCFFGSLYPGIRDPRRTISLFSAAGEGIEMRFIGKVVGAEPETFFPEGCACRLTGEVSGAALAKEYRDAEVLVNIGNAADNQMPSKIFEYISTGKPIINIVKSPNCPTLKYMKKYPLALNLQEADIAPHLPEKAAEVRAFCRETRGKRVPADTIAELYADNTYEHFAQTVLRALETDSADPSAREK